MRESESPGPLAIVVGSLLTVDTVNGSLISFRVAGTEHHYMAAPFPWDTTSTGTSQYEPVTS